MSNLISTIDSLKSVLSPTTSCCCRKDWEKLNTLSLPTDYLENIKELNGGEAFIGEEYLVLWSPKEALEFRNENLDVALTHKFFFFGGNGGGEGLAIKFETNEIYIIPLVDVNEESAIKVSDSFTDLILHLKNGGEYFI